MPVDNVRKLIHAIDNGKTEFNLPPFKLSISNKLRELLEIPEPIKIDKLQKQIEDIQKLLNNFKISNANNGVKDETSE